MVDVGFPWSGRLLAEARLRGGRILDQDACGRP